jgi:hypothetical protein
MHGIFKHGGIIDSLQQRLNELSTQSEQLHMVNLTDVIDGELEESLYGASYRSPWESSRKQSS